MTRRPWQRAETFHDWAALRDACLREARRYLPEADAQDAVQEALLRGVRHLDRCRTLEAPGAWLQAIARNEALRRRARREEGPIVADVPDPEAGDELGRAGARVDMVRALRRLSAAERRIMALRYVLDMTNADVARHLGIPEGTARVRLHRARRRLRALMAT